VDAAGRTVRPPVVPRPGLVSYAALLRRNLVGMHGAVLYRREAILAAGGFDAALRSCEDHDLYLRLARRAPVHAHASLVAEYRRHAGGLSARPIQMIDTGLEVLRRQRPFLDTAALWQAYRAGIRFTLAKHGYHLGRRVLAQAARGEWRGPTAEIGALARKVPYWLSL